MIPGLLDTVSAVVIRSLDHFIHKYAPNFHDQAALTLYNQWHPVNQNLDLSPITSPKL